MPDKPAPTIRTSTCSAMGVSSYQWERLYI
jgi:hypothetical protein